MNNETFNNKILARIHNEKMRPRSRWYFVTERWFFIAMIALATVIGSIAITTSLFVLTDHDWFVVDHLEEGLFVHIINTIPYVWIIVVALVIAIVRINVKKIGRGYRIASQKIITLSLLTSFVVGTILFFAGAGSYLDRYFDRHIPSYRTLVSSNNDIWVYPEDGLLSGKIITTTPNNFTLIDSDDQPWAITTSPTTQIDTPIVTGTRIKIVGTMTDGSDFTADMILPWKNERK